MCYSALVEQDHERLARLGIPIKVRIDHELAVALFRQRAEDPRSIQVARAYERQFTDRAATPAEKEIARLSEDYRRWADSEDEKDLFAQKKRLADAERKLQGRPTKKAEADKRIAEKKILWRTARIRRRSARELDEEDFRIFPLYHAPLIVLRGGEGVVEPHRYQLRRHGMPADIDRKLDTFNVRRDSLAPEAFAANPRSLWKPLFMRNHALLAFRKFYEWVSLHHYEGRELREGEKESKIQICFDPKGDGLLYGPCLHDTWAPPGGGEPLRSFALMTDEPPPEVARAGHDRSPVLLKAENVPLWGSPGGHSPEEIHAILKDPLNPGYATRVIEVA